MAAVAQAATRELLAQQVLPIRAAVVAAVAHLRVMVAQAAQASSSFPTLAHNEALAAQ